MEEKEIVVAKGIDIEKIDVSRVESILQKVSEFQEVVRKTLREGHDYGVIPGASKPTLLKPGAEKILMLLGLSSSYEILEALRDYDKGLFAFTIKCILSKDGIPITEGLGHANVKEKKYVSGKASDPFTLANTVLKVAKKRAQVDATLTVGSLSEIFTQDMEDMIDEDEPIGQSHPAHREETDKITEKQLHKILELMKAYVQKLPEEDAEAYKLRREEVLAKKLGKPPTELTKKEASRVIEKLEKQSKEAPF